MTFFLLFVFHWTSSFVYICRLVKAILKSTTLKANLQQQRKVSVAKRFADTSQDEIEKKRLKLQSDNTLKSNKKAANILKAYLTENLTMDNFENCPPEELAIVLERFYMDLRKHGTMYKTTSLESIRSGLEQILAKSSHQHEI